MDGTYSPGQENSSLWQDDKPLTGVSDGRRWLGLRDDFVRATAKCTDNQRTLPCILIPTYELSILNYTEYVRSDPLVADGRLRVGWPARRQHSLPRRAALGARHCAIMGQAPVEPQYRQAGRRERGSRNALPDVSPTQGAVQ